MRTLIVALTVVLLTVPAFSQGMQGMSHGSKHRGADQKAQPVQNKANEKDYKSALDRLPDQKSDPWGTIRPGDAKH